MLKSRQVKTWFNMEEKIINKVQNSSIITLDLNDYYVEGDRAIVDLKDNLEKGFLLREKDFREFVKQHDWEQYREKFVAVHCSADAIVPKWAYMLIASKLSGVAKKVVFGNEEELESKLFLAQIENINPVDYRDSKVVVKGCGKIDTPASVFMEISNILTPYVSSLMYGEPCSTVPIYKKPKN